MKMLTFDLNYRPHYEERLHGTNVVQILRDEETLSVVEIQSALKRWMETGAYHMALIWQERNRPDRAETNKGK